MTYQDRDPRLNNALATRGGQSTTTGWIIGIAALFAIVGGVYFLPAGVSKNTASNDNTGKIATNTPNTNTTGAGTPAPAPAPNR